MKPLHLLDYAGNVRPGRATLETITDVIEGRELNRLATVDLDVNGALVVTPLDEHGLAALRIDLGQRRRDSLRAALNHALALVNAADGIPGVSACSYYSGVMTIDVGASPWAEELVIAWADEVRLHIVGEPMPGKPGKWTRTAEVKLDPEPYSTSVVSIRWPTIDLTVNEMVARDADESGRPDMATALRADDRQAVGTATEEPF